MFPIQDRRGQIIGFGGRVLAHGEPKYLNSPETALFEKGRELYGLPQARPSIRAQGRVLVVEGYMDVVALAQHGIGYAVATLGTATTAIHAQTLLRLADEVIFCFDGDAAGRRAAWRALENTLAELADGKQVGFLFLPEADDPDTFVRREGREGFEGALRERVMPLSSFLIEELRGRRDLGSEEGRANFLALAKPLLEKIRAPGLRLMLRKRAAELTGLQADELSSLYGPAPTAPLRVAAPAPTRRAGRVAPSLARKLLQLLVFEPRLVEAYGADGAAGARSHLADVLSLCGRSGWCGGEAQALKAVLEFLRDHPQISHAGPLVEHFRETGHGALLYQVEQEVLQWGEDFAVKQEFQGALDQVEALLRHEKIDALRQKGLGALTSEERQLLQRLLREPGQAEKNQG